MMFKICVMYEDQKMAYDMPVGNGRMTIKWLGLSAAQRFSSTIKPRGHRRHRERAGPSKILCASASLLPRRMYTAQSTFLHPDKSIREELRQGEEVFVMLTSKMPVNDLGRPLRERWMFIAFCVSKQTENERNTAIAEEYREMADEKMRLEQEAKASDAELAAKKGALMKRVMISQLYSREKIEQAFEWDWARLCHPVTQPIDKITEDVEEQLELKEVVLKHYVTLVEVFKYYASIGSSVTTGEIDIMEFSALMHDLRGYNVSKSREIVEKLFAEAIGACREDKLQGRQQNAGAMGMIEFLFCIIRLACTRYHVYINENSIGSTSAGGEYVNGASRQKSANSVHEALDQFMESALLPLAHRKIIGLQIKTALASDEILAVYHDFDSSLKKVFDKYCTALDRVDAPAVLGVLLNIAEFRLILKDCGLLGGNKEDDELTMKEARQAFAGAQNDLCGGDTYGTPHSAHAVPQIEQMTYPEFLEGIARVAMLKWEDVSSTSKTKIERAVIAVTSLLGNTTEQVNPAHEGAHL